MKSDIEIAKFVYHKIKGSSLESGITGKLSDRKRPNKSDREDIVISVLANEGCGQIQRAYVNVNVYVKDQWNARTKAWEINTQRVKELCELCKFLFTLYEDGIHTVHLSAAKKPILPVFLLKMVIQSISSITNCILRFVTNNFNYIK